jgi:hypothetical protein
MHAADPQTVFDFPLAIEIATAAAALNILLGFTHHRVLGYWSWCLRSRSHLDKIAFVLLLIGQGMTIAALAAIVPVTHELIGVRPTSELAEWFLIVEAVLAGWAAFTLLREPRGVARGDGSLTDVLTHVLRAAITALDDRSRVCVRPALERAMEKDEASRSRILNSLRDCVGAEDRPAADLITTNLMKAWSQGETERNAGMTAFTNYINDLRIAPGRFLRTR